MATTELHTIGPQEVGTTVINQITRCDVTEGISELVSGTSGQTRATYSALLNRAPVISCESLNPKAVLDLSTAIGSFLDIDASPATKEFKAYWSKRAEGGVIASGSVHRKCTVNEGILVPRRLTCDHGGQARISYDVVATYDGSNVPLVWAGSAALPSGIADSLFWTIGPATLQAATLDQIKSVSIDFGIGLIVEGSDSDLAPTFVAVSSIRPSITIRTSKQSIDTSYDDGGVALTSDFILYFRKRTEGGSFVADGTAEHIKLTVNEGRAHMRSVRGGDRNDIEIVVTPIYDGTNEVLLFDTASAIS